jgi:hypothetical protein
LKTARSASRHPKAARTKSPPSAIFIATWNPGYEGDADRPAQAFLSRITALPLDYPDKDEQIRRVKAHFEKEGLEMPKDEIPDAAVGFWNDLRLLTGSTGQMPQVCASSPTRTTPGVEKNKTRMFLPPHGRCRSCPPPRLELLLIISTGSGVSRADRPGSRARQSRNSFCKILDKSNSLIIMGV